MRKCLRATEARRGLDYERISKRSACDDHRRPPIPQRGPMKFVSADPYPWPFDGALEAQNTALVVIDMQTDFCGKGGYIDLLGYDISVTRACVEPIQRVLEKMRALDFHVIHTRKGHRSDLSELP